jgi:hypothetical protein
MTLRAIRRTMYLLLFVAVLLVLRFASLGALPGYIPVLDDLLRIVEDAGVQALFSLHQMSR